MKTTTEIQFRPAFDRDVDEKGLGLYSKRNKTRSIVVGFVNYYEIAQ